MVLFPLRMNSCIKYVTLRSHLNPISTKGNQFRSPFTFSPITNTRQAFLFLVDKIQLNDKEIYSKIFQNLEEYLYQRNILKITTFIKKCFHPYQSNSKDTIRHFLLELKNEATLISKIHTSDLLGALSQDSKICK